MVLGVHKKHIFQMLAGLIVGLEAMWKWNPEIFVDSTGYPLTMPLFKALGGCQVACYVHYPTISADMIELVESRRDTYNNASIIASNRFLSQAKLLYYQGFAFLYKLCGMGADVVLVNSTWTFGHIADLWNRPGDTVVVYPPCDVQTFTESVKNVAESHLPDVRILSIGQIRPEKNHRLQLEILQELKKRAKKAVNPFNLKLVIAGGCRNDEDVARVEQLKDYGRSLGVADDVIWKLNVSFAELKEELSLALIGIHTMWNEHFGISVVEGMASGNIMIAHASGGPKLDILKLIDDRCVGFLASTVEEYAQAIQDVLEMSCEQRDAIRLAAKDATQKFTEVEFSSKISQQFEPLFN